MIESKEHLPDIERPWKEAPEEWAKGMMRWVWDNDGTTYLKELIKYKKIEEDGHSWENVYEIRYKLPDYIAMHIKNREKRAKEEIQRNIRTLLGV